MFEYKFMGEIKTGTSNANKKKMYNYLSAEIVLFFFRLSA